MAKEPGEPQFEEEKPEKELEFLSLREKEFCLQTIKEFTDYWDSIPANSKWRKHLKSSEEAKTYFSNFLNKDYVQKSIAELDPMPLDAFEQFPMDEIRKAIQERQGCSRFGSQLNNFYMRLQCGETGSDIIKFPAIMRFRLLQPKLAREVQESVDKYWSERVKDRSKEDIELIDWEKVFEAYHQIIRLVDRRDIDANANIGLTLEESWEQDKELEKEWRTSGYFTR